MEFNPARENLCRSAAVRAGELSGFTIPWDLIQQLVEWFLENCFSNARARERFVDVARAPGTFQQVALYRQALALGRGHWSGRDLRSAAHAITSAVIEIGESAPEADLRAAAG